jgi:hypothetical protein
MKLGAMTGLGCTQGIEPELWKKREQKESMRRVENKKRSGQNQIRGCAAGQKRER